MSDCQRCEGMTRAELCDELGKYVCFAEEIKALILGEHARYTQPKHKDRNIWERIGYETDELYYNYFVRDWDEDN